MVLDARRRRDQPRAMFTSVFLDGKELTDCVKVDTRRGLAWCYAVETRADGKTVWKLDEDRKPIVEMKHGKVRLRSIAA